jgi:hypothetical protein
MRRRPLSAVCSGASPAPRDHRPPSDLAGPTRGDGMDAQRSAHRSHRHPPHPGGPTRDARLPPSVPESRGGRSGTARSRRASRSSRLLDRTAPRRRPPVRTESGLDQRPWLGAGEPSHREVELSVRRACTGMGCSGAPVAASKGRLRRPRWLDARDPAANLEPWARRWREPALANLVEERLVAHHENP